MRNELSATGAKLMSETDTETIVHLARSYLAEGMTTLEATHVALGRLEGAFALAFLFEVEADLLSCRTPWLTFGDRPWGWRDVCRLRCDCTGTHH